MAFNQPPPKPKTALGYHRILSPSAGVKVSPMALGGISLGSSWSEVFGKNEDPFELLDAYVALGGNFIDTSKAYNYEESERFIGEWMEKRGIRDQMVVATKYSAAYRAYKRDEEPFQSNYAGNSAKSMHISVRDSLRKLRTDYIDILYVHWWDFATSVEEVMTHLHAYVMARQVLYLGVSDTPAWVVVIANDYARSHGLTPFSVYQGSWNAALRDMEAEIIPMCEDQGMAIVPWAALGGGQLMDAQQMKDSGKQEDARQTGEQSEGEKLVSQALEKLAGKYKTTVQAISTYVFPIVGVQTVEHVKAMPDALRVELTTEDVDAIQNAIPFDPGFPMNFLYSFRVQRPYNLRRTAADNQHYQIAAWIDAPPKQQPYRVRSKEDDA